MSGREHVNTNFYSNKFGTTYTWTQVLRLIAFLQLNKYYNLLFILPQIVVFETFEKQKC